MCAAVKSIHCVPKNEIRIIVNTLCSCEYTAMKFTMQYPDGFRLSY